MMSTTKVTPRPPGTPGVSDIVYTANRHCISVGNPAMFRYSAQYRMLGLFVVDSIFLSG